MHGLTLSRHETPLGPLLAVTQGVALCILEFEDQPQRLHRALRRRGLESPPSGHHALPALAAYFAGDLKALDTIAIDPGGTPFQQAAWSALRRLPPGVTTTYADMARALGRPAAPRAVGAANGANPLAIVLPCHRLVGAGGALTGYGGGLPRKAWLLEHERRHA